jgi:long-chain acyl-CoA synthetase
MFVMQFGHLSGGGYKTKMNSGHVLSAAAEGNPRMAAVVLKDERISYEQSDRATTSLAQWFFWQGCKPGDRVAVHWPNSIEAVKLFFACFKAGMIVVPLNVHMKAHEAAYVLEHCRAFNVWRISRSRKRLSF